MNSGCAQVSTEDQNPDLQLAALKKIGCERIFIEKSTEVCPADGTDSLSQDEKWTRILGQ